MYRDDFVLFLADAAAEQRRGSAGSGWTLSGPVVEKMLQNVDHCFTPYMLNVTFQLCG